MPEHARTLAYYDHPFFGKWPAITENEFGKGTLLYEGTYWSDVLQTAVLKAALTKAGLTGPDQHVPAQVHVQHGVNRMGKNLHYYLLRGRADDAVPLWRRHQSAERRYGGAGEHSDPETVGPCNCGRAVRTQPSVAT
jgi:beta-galactosidase